MCKCVYLKQERVARGGGMRAWGPTFPVHFPTSPSPCCIAAAGQVVLLLNDPSCYSDTRTYARTHTNTHARTQPKKACLQ